MKHELTKLQIGKCLIGLCFLIFYSSNSFTQTSLSGTVTEEATGSTIPFADVVLYNNDVLVTGVQTDFDGNYRFDGIDPGTYDVEARFLAYETVRKSNVVVPGGQNIVVDFALGEAGVMMDEIVITEYKVPLISLDMTSSGTVVTANKIRSMPSKNIAAIAGKTAGLKKVKRWFGKNQQSHNQQILIKQQPNCNTESYAHFEENTFKQVSDNPLSTFSIDVDGASYSNVRRLINNGQTIDPGAVRIEEMINYFDYEYPNPQDEVFGVNTTLTKCPWNPKNQLLRVGIQGKRMDKNEIPNSNLVFLVDVSGSMSSSNKLGLVKKSLKLLVENLKATDRVAIVTYAGSSRVALESTPARQLETIYAAINKLHSGGSTAGAEGIKTAYKIAKENFIKKGNNRVILATDGDFNVGVSSNDGLVALISEQRASNIFLSVLGYGMGNYQDDKMQLLADKGNGNHAYIDNMEEARKVLVTELQGTLITIAKDMKIQIEFNPKLVGAYRLVGYENRMLADEDFNDDKKDAGELGAGHDVTALYEIIQPGRKVESIASIDPLKYQNVPVNNLVESDELATVKLRYKKPKAKNSTKIEHIVSSEPIALSDIDADLAFCLSVAEFGMILRDSDYKKKASISSVIKLAKKGKKDLPYRAEFVKLVKKYDRITSYNQ